MPDKSTSGSSVGAQPITGHADADRCARNWATAQARPRHPWWGGFAKRACGRWSIGSWKQTSGAWSETRLSPDAGLTELRTELGFA
jgi:hypothetical protein